MKRRSFQGEIWYRLRGKIKIRLGNVILIIISNIIGLLIYYRVQILRIGIQGAKANLDDTILSVLFVEIMAAILYFLYMWIFGIPKEIYYEQIKFIESYNPNRLNIFVGTNGIKRKISSNEYSFGIQTASLIVINQEAKKITEFHATRHELLYRTEKTETGVRGNVFGINIMNFRFEWEDGKTITEILPGETDNLLIATFDPSVGYPVFGEAKVFPHKSDIPSIYEIHIQFVGKLEGETEFRYYDYIEELYFHPQDGILDFAENAINTDMPEKLKPKVLFVKIDT